MAAIVALGVCRVRAVDKHQVTWLGLPKKPIAISRLGESEIVCIQNGMFADTRSEPKPDVVIAKPLPELFGPFEPSPEDVLLLVEISDTSVRYDKEIKAPLYAEAGIPEYWVLNIPEDVLEVRSDPMNGEYRRTEIYKRGQTIVAKHLPGTVFTIDEPLG